MLVLQGPKFPIENLTFSPDGKWLVTPRPYPGKGVYRWAVSGGAAAPEVLCPDPNVRSVHFTTDGAFVLLDGPRLVIRPVATGEGTEVRFPDPYTKSVRVDLLPDSRQFLARLQVQGSDSTERLVCRNLASPELEVWTVALDRAAYWGAVFLPGEEQFILGERWNGTQGGEHGTAFVTRDAKTGETVSEVRVQSGMLRPPSQSSDYRYVATGEQNRITVYRTDDFREPVAVIKGTSKKEVTATAFHPSGRFLAATSNDTTVKLYDTTTWRLDRTFTWDVGRLRSVAFSPDGALAAVGSDTGRVVVWDVDL